MMCQLSQAARRCPDGGLDGVEVLDAIRSAVRDGFLISLRFTANEFIEGGITEEYGIAIAKIHAASGLVDCLNVSGAANWTKAGVAETVPAMAFPAGRFAELAGKVRRATGLPVLHAADVGDLATANFAVSEGHVDLIGMTRAQIAGPHMVRKHLDGKDEEIRPSVGAGYCIDRIHRGGDGLCLHNAATGRETVLSHNTGTAPGRLKIVITGAGPAGLEAARLCAGRGPSVTVLEAQSDPGGQVAYAARIPWRQNIIGITRWLYARCEALGVSFRFTTYAETEDILQLSPDVVILATGGMPEMGPISGGEALGHSVWEILSGEVAAKGEVLIYDETGGQSGRTAAEFLAAAGARVTLMTPGRMIADDAGVTNHAIDLRNLYAGWVDIRSDRRLTSLRRSDGRISATVITEYGGQAEMNCFDQVVIETGTVPMNDLYEELGARAINKGTTDPAAMIAAERQPCLTGVRGTDGHFALFRIGDCVSARGVHAAVLDAARLCQPL